jgi:hypothetical protein
MRHWLYFSLVILFMAACSFFESWNPSEQTADVGLIETDPTNCASNAYITLCIKEATLDPNGTQILVEAILTDDRLQLVWPFAPGDHELPEDPTIFLVDASGSKFEYVVDITFPEPGDITVDGVRTEQLFQFPPLPSDVGPLTIHLPSVVVQAPLNSSIQLDLGKTPSPGSSYLLDASISLLGQSIVFDRAEIDSQLYLHLYSAPIDLGGDVILRWLHAGMPEGWSSGTGPGNKYDFEVRRQHLWFPMIESDGASNTGILSIPLYSAVLYLIGPFDMTLQYP